MKKNLHHYQSSSGRDVIEKYIDKLSKDEQVDAHHVLKKIQDDETDLLTIQSWKGKIKEVYFYKDNRFFFIVEHGTDVYVLHACRKQKNKTEKKDKKIVLQRAKELEAMLKAQK